MYNHAYVHNAHTSYSYVQKKKPTMPTGLQKVWEGAIPSPHICMCGTYEFDKLPEL